MTSVKQTVSFVVRHWITGEKSKNSLKIFLIVARTKIVGNLPSYILGFYTLYLISSWFGILVTVNSSTSIFLLVSFFRIYFAKTEAAKGDHFRDN